MVNTFEDDVALAAISAYNKLPKTGKPQTGREWTLLAAILKTEDHASRDNGEHKIEVICLATGSKCIGKGKRKDDGSIVNDSHAEVLARRLLLKYFYDQIRFAECNFTSIFERSTRQGRFALKPGVKFHLFTSHTPCGDCSIIPKSDEVVFDKTTNVFVLQETRKRKVSNASDSESISMEAKKKKENHSDTFEVDRMTSNKDLPQRKLIREESEPIRQAVGNSETEHGSRDAKIELLREEASQVTSNSASQKCSSLDNLSEFSHCSGDIHRTGAKCVPKGKQDPRLCGSDYHVIAALRTKPGRGEKTLSMSCSDKIMKWCTLGVQGGLLSSVLESPIYLDSIVIGKCPFSRDAMLRGISLRGRDIKFAEGASFNYHCPAVYHCENIEFPDSKNCVEDKRNEEPGFGKVSASGASILFCCKPNIHEVIVNGKKQGTTKKHNSNKESWPSVCKAALWKDFQSLLSIVQAPTDALSDLAVVNYHKAKLDDQDYQLSRKTFFGVFHDWMPKPPEDELFS